MEAIAQAPCSDFDIAFVQKNMLNCSGTPTFTLYNTGGGSLPSAVAYQSDAGFSAFSLGGYNPSTGEVTISSASINNYQEYGTFTLTVTINGEDCEITGHIVECCESLTPDVIAVDEPINNYTSTGSFTSETILIFGDVTFNAGSYDFDGCEIRLGPDAELLPSTSTDITFENGTSLTPYCSCRWDRILLTGTTTGLTMDDATMTGALRGIMATNEAPIELIDSDFDDNLVSVYLNNFSTGGSFNGSYLKVDGCTFDATVAPSEICYSSSSVNMNTVYPSSTYCVLPTMDILVKNSVDVHVGHESYDPNTFENNSSNDKSAIVGDASQVFVRNNLFYEVTAICSDNTSKMIVGGTVAQGNVIDNSEAIFNETSMFFEENYVSSSAIELYEPTSQSVISGYDEGVQFNTNSFYESDLFIDGNGNPNTANCRIYDNLFTFTEVEMIDYPLAISGFAPFLRRIVFHSNDMVQDNNATLVKIEDCGSLVLANNEFDNLVYRTPAGANEYKGVKWKNSEDGVVSNNYFRNFNRAMDVHNDNSGLNTVEGTQFTCNEFVNCYHPFYLSSVTLEDQGASNKATDNCFQYYYTGSTFPYGDQIIGTVQGGVSFDWYSQDPSSCSFTSQPASGCHYCITESVSDLDIPGAAATPNACTVPANKSAIATKPNVKEESVKDVLGKLVMYPNPSSGIVNIVVPANLLNQQMEVYDLQGRHIFGRAVGSESIELNVAEWTPGLYLVKVGDATAKLIVK